MLASVCRVDSLHLVPEEVNSRSDRHQFTVVEEVATATVEVSVAELDS